ncbi:hypothetical protein CLOM_g18992 [Closterium sp. NIES-68]|nr:hypothetical protein CLOM_g18992 [Closterium sp. NIES-68]GJP66168.1 hypothetical protein CLOP_g23073 [Closterium sp. NIES-67]
MESRLRAAAYQQRVRRAIGCVLLVSLLSLLLLASLAAKSGAVSGGARGWILHWLQIPCASSPSQSASERLSSSHAASGDVESHGLGDRGGGGLSERHVYDGGGYGGGRQCERVTKVGICVSDFFALIDDVYRPLWPGKVDLVIRSYLSEKLFLLYSLLTSVELMWPRGIGRIVLVLDEGDDVAMHLVPPWVQVKYERNYLKLPGKILQQWSYGWADNYTSAPFVAIADDDIIFNLKVTPFLLLNLSQGNSARPYLIGSKDQGYHRPSTDFLLGRRAYAANFMVQLPFVIPRGEIKGYRDAVAAAHPKIQGGYDGAVQQWVEKGGQYRDQIAHTVMGNYLWHNAKDKMEFALEWTDHTPIPRVGVHLPYTNLFKDLGGLPSDSKLNLSFVQSAAHYQRETICHSLPPGELAGCEGVQQQTHIWRYAWDRQRWRQLRRRGAGMQIYERHIRELHCIYRGMAKHVGERGGEGEGGVRRGGDAEEEGRLVVSVEGEERGLLVERLRSECIEKWET